MGDRARREAVADLEAGCQQAAKDLEVTEQGMADWRAFVRGSEAKTAEINTHLARLGRGPWA